MRLLELFSGAGSVGRAFRAKGWEVTSVDSDPKAEPTICQDIMTWEPGGAYDMIWATPVCTEYSRAMTSRPRDLEARDSDFPPKLHSAHSPHPMAPSHFNAPTNDTIA